LALKIKDYELKKNEERLKFSSQGKTSAEEKTRLYLDRVTLLREKNSTLEKDHKNIIRNLELTEIARTKLIQEDREIQSKNQQNKGRGFSR
jgi:hypothetical protein